VSSKPKLSALIHLCRKPSGAGGASKDEGGVHSTGRLVASLVSDARESFFTSSVTFETSVSGLDLVMLITPLRLLV
jgi:hypothetical protein